MIITSNNPDTLSGLAKKSYVTTRQVVDTSNINGQVLSRLKDVIMGYKEMPNSGQCAQLSLLLIKGLGLPVMQMQSSTGPSSNLMSVRYFNLDVLPDDTQPFEKVKSLVTAERAASRMHGDHAIYSVDSPKPIPESYFFVFRHMKPVEELQKIAKLCRANSRVRSAIYAINKRTPIEIVYNLSK